MFHNQWYPNHAEHHGQAQPSPEPGGTHAKVATDSVREAHRLFVTYPSASATPTAHVARHLSNLSITATTPSYMLPQYQSHHNTPHYYSTAHPAPYTEHSNEISYLASPSMPPGDRGYWRSSRDEVNRFIPEGGPMPSASYSLPPQWSQAPGAPSTYQTPAFANSVLQRMHPASAYPTPPPPGIRTTSSSLAFALGPPTPRTNNGIRKPEESAPFFNSFLSQRSRDLDIKITEPSSAQLHAEPTFKRGPDPLAVAPPASPVTTPLKRKSADPVNTPSVKRIHTLKDVRAPSASATPSSSKSTPRQMFAYVQVPPLPASYFTPSKKQHNQIKMPEGRSDEEDDYHSGYEHLESVKSSARRTGDRDDRGPLEKLTALIEDIFEAEDALPADVDLADLPKEFFSPLTVDCTQPCLQPNLVRKLTKHISQLARPAKRIRRTAREGGSGGTPQSRNNLSHVESVVLSRLLKILDRSVRAGEDLDPFGSALTREVKNASPRKPKKTPKLKKHTPVHDDLAPAPHDDLGDSLEHDKQVEDDQMEVDESEKPQQLTDTDVVELARRLDVARDSITASECCIALLSADGLTKQLYSEELITTCLSAVKNQLTKIVYPFVEAAAAGGPTTSHIQCLHKNTHSSSHDLRRQLNELFQALSAILPRINSLISGETLVMSDAIIIQMVYIAIGPFFVIESGSEGDAKGKKDNVVLNTLGSSAMRALRLDALSLIRTIFANHEEQRSWIIEEILTSLIRLSNSNKKAGQFRLRDGRSIRTVSALLLQLVQTSAHDVRIAAREIAKSRQRRLALRRQDSINDKTVEPQIDELDAEEIQLYVAGLESATNAAKTVIIFLTQRSGKGKLTKNSNEAEYRTILDNLIFDLLVVLYWPEWPAASLLLGIVCRFMVSSLDDVKTSNQTDTNGAKSIALDHLGVIAARIRSSILKVKHREGGAGIRSLEEIVASESPKDLEKLFAKHQDISSHLCKRSSDDQAYDSARELTAATWGQELAVAFKQLYDDLQTREDKETKPPSSIKVSFCDKLKSTLRDVWKDHSTDVFDMGTQEEIARIDQLAEDIGTVQGLRSSFGPILNVILLALDAPPVFMRTKALRALGQIVTSDSSILSAPNVRRAIESHLLDSSPAVRDAAVELIGKYMIDSPEVAGDYYHKIAERIADTGLGVRKRVIKLLKLYYAVTDNVERRIDVTTKLVLRMLDEDDTVKDLAIKTVEELWFQNTLPQGPTAKTRSTVASGSHLDKGPLLSKVSVIMGVSTNFKDRQSPLEEMLHKIVTDRDRAEATSLRASYVEICETLIDGLVDASDLPDFTVHGCIRTIYLFTTAYPSVLSGSNASTLLPYLKNPTSPEEMLVSDYLLKIFRLSIPHMPKTAIKFGQELQLVLQPMILKPSNVGGVLSLQESVACMCGVVQNLTHDFNRLVALVKSCNARLQQALARPNAEKMTAVEVRTLSILIFIVSLLGEHCDFDRLRDEREEFASDLDGVSKGPVIEHIYSSLLSLYKKYDDAGLRGRILQCLGFLFRAQPTLMTLEQSANIMDAIFSSSDEENRGRLLRIMQDFLVSEASKHAAQQKGNIRPKANTNVDMGELVGNTDGFADSGVSSAVVQRYITPILDAALSQHMHIQAVAVDILSFTVRQGLAHPLQSFPVIVALGTSPVVTMSARANALHAILHSKHMSLLNARYVVSARHSFDYQKKISAGPVLGYRMQPDPIALLQRWHSLVREKRGPRMDFLKSLVRVFDIGSSMKSSQDDVDFARYMTENFSAFDYRTQEEVIVVIKHLTSVLSTTGMQLIEMISPSHLLAQLHDSPALLPMSQQIDAPPPAASTTQGKHHTSFLSTWRALQPCLGATARPLDIAVMRSSVVIGMIMLLKTHLKVLYGLSEEKCSKFVSGKKSAIGDKPAIKRHQNPITWDRLPFATVSITSIQDLQAQKTTFLEVWNADGVTAEPEDDLA
ncbi:hypothetical protein BV22DRAFT_1088167 [Leucogyrophana mollusca]|uniref:Uncharacterized protein n=1 Tax=Leucogyrophana mollusca TaxID=85980 RepID=A0ACB8BJ86_9AGAM|nr:hypothetical protein BV22DRAFT_1088167 [Leucogyrophana mollusca]